MASNMNAVTTKLSHLSTIPSDGPPDKTHEQSKPEDDDEEANTQATKPTDASSEPKSASTQPTDVGSDLSNSKTNVVLDMKIKSSKRINTKIRTDLKELELSGCCFMPEGELIMCDRKNKKLKLYKKSFEFSASLTTPGKPWDVALLNFTNVIVTYPWDMRLQFIQVLPTLQKGPSVKVDNRCYGVDVVDGRTYVSCPLGKAGAEVQIFDFGGKLENKIGIDMPWCQSDYIAVSKTGNKIFVSDGHNDEVICLTNNGGVVYQYKDRELRNLQGLYVDDADNIIASGSTNRTLHIITDSGTKNTTLLESAGYDEVQSIAFRETDKTLAAGCGHILWVYKLTQ